MWLVIVQHTASQPNKHIDNTANGKLWLDCCRIRKYHPKIVHAEIFIEAQFKHNFRWPEIKHFSNKNLIYIIFGLADKYIHLTQFRFEM